MSQTHSLKTWPEQFQAVMEGRKDFEYRLNDRNYCVGDVLHLREYVPGGDLEGDTSEEGYYTGRELFKRVKYVLDATEFSPSAFRKLPQHVVMGLEPLHVGADINPQPWVPMSDPSDIKVIGKSLEELGEAISANARALIQGMDAAEPSTGRINRDWVQNEHADVMATSAMVVERFGLDPSAMAERSTTKRNFLRKWLRMLTLSK